MLIKSLKLVCCFSILINYAFALKIPKNDTKIVNSYYRSFNKFVKQNCKRGYEFKYQVLLREYRGNGIYYPKLGKRIDFKTIKENLHVVQAKKNWINKEIKKLSKSKRMPRYSRSLIELQKIVNELLELKGKVLFENENIERNTNKSQKLLIKLEKEFDELILKISFLTNFSYPVDHLSNRRKFDNLKGKKKISQSNAVFFNRKLLEDGTLDRSGSYPDMFLRTSLDTIKLKFKEKKDFLDEELRYDLEWAFKKISRILGHGQKHMLTRLKKWELKVETSIKSYKQSLKEKNKKNSSLVKLLSEHDRATGKLISYVYPKEAKTYRFWLKQKELNKALYVLSTILFNEVGDVDPQGLERADVLKIVMNRKKINYYRKLHPRQKLSRLLGKKERSSWLNILFRRGEFSFTYHYIPSVKKLFCPDMSPRGKALRRQNLKISLDILRNYKNGFKPTRYFSRHSMVGKIDMSDVWQSYDSELEKAGKSVKNVKKLNKLLKSEKYRYLYQFDDKNKVKRHVLEFESNPYVVTRHKSKQTEFHTYRNPHYFKYFTKR